MTGQLVSRNHKTVKILSESVSPGGFKITPFTDADGFNEVAITLHNEGGYSTKANLVWSHDGVNSHGEETEILPPATNRRRAISTSVKARYFNINVTNNDASARTLNMWAYLKS